MVISLKKKKDGELNNHAWESIKAMKTAHPIVSPKFPYLD
jgi:hypothetical protein